MNFSKKTKVLIISHGFRLESGGPAQDIRDYLLDKVGEIVYVDHPFPNANYNSSHFFFYKSEVLKQVKRVPIIPFLEALLYSQQLFITFFFLLFSKDKYDVCFSLDNHSVFAASLFRKLGKIKKLIYYSIDYTPQRFKGSFMNSLYHFLDRFACRNSDLNWVVAKHMVDARRENGVDLSKSSPFKEVPMGFGKQDVKVLPIQKIFFYNLVYMGTILEKQGIQLAIESLPKLITTFPQMHLIVIGAGDFEDQLKKQVEQLGITENVTFKGFIGYGKEMIELILQGSVGLAPYKPVPGSFSYWSDPSKIKIYLGCGLPVITTNVTAFSKVIQEKGAGIVIDYKTDEFCKAVISLLGEVKTYNKYRERAIALSKNYQTKEILKKALQEI